MQRLHVVGFTPDHEGLILSVRRGTRTGAYTVEVDANFEEVLADLIKERGGEAEPRIPRAESQLSVREMQQRLRSGQTIHQVARAAGVNDDWVARFAVPIQAEQTQVIRQAFDLTFSKQRLGVSSQPLGVSVWWNLQDRSAALDEESWENGWSAFLVRDAQWVVRFDYEARKRRQIAEWEVDLRAGTLTSRNRLATELGYVESGRRRRPGPPPPVAGGLVTRPAPAADAPSAPASESEPSAVAAASKRGDVGRGAKKAAAKKSAAKKSSAKKSAAKKSVAKKSAPKKSAAKKSTPKKAAAKKSAPKKAGGQKSAPKRIALKRTAAKKSGGVKKTAAKKAPAKKAVAQKAPVRQPVTRNAPAGRAPARKAPATKKSSPRSGAAKKSSPRKAAAAAKRPPRPAPVRPVVAAAPRPLTSPPVPVANSYTPRAPVVSAQRAREAVPSEHQPAITPPPSPSTPRRRFFGRR